MDKAVLICVGIIVLVLMRSNDPASAPAAPDKTPRITAVERAKSFIWDSSVSAYDRQLIEQAIAGADPRAQALIAEVDGVTSIMLGAIPGAAGSTLDVGNGFYTVMLDLGGVQRNLGPRGISRLVLHELGHVIDLALVDDGLNAQLDAAIPVGAPCPPGTPLGACAPQEERFAETFAKWAMNDIGINLYIGYHVAPPADLEAWAQPLLELT